MKKLGCAKCGGTKKMKLGGSAVAKAPVNIFGIPQENMGTSSQMGFGKKGGTVKKEHVLTTFRKANEARQAVVKKSLPKAEVGMSTGYPKKPVIQAPSNKYNPGGIPKGIDKPVKTNNSKPTAKATPKKGASNADVGMFETTPITRPGETPRSAMARINSTSNTKGIKPKRVDSSRVRAGVSAKTPATPKSPEPVRKPSIEFGDPNVGFKYNKPQPKTKYEDAVINTKSPSTRTAAIPRSSAKAPVQHTSRYTPKRGATTSTKTAAKPVSGYTPKRGATTSVKKTVGPKPRSTASAITAGMAAGPAGYAISNMFKKKGGQTKSSPKPQDGRTVKKVGPNKYAKEQIIVNKKDGSGAAYVATNKGTVYSMSDKKNGPSSVLSIDTTGYSKGKPTYDQLYTGSNGYKKTTVKRKDVKPLLNSMKKEALSYKKAGGVVKSKKK